MLDRNMLDYESKRVYNAGREDGVVDTLAELFKDKLLSAEEAAKRTGMTIDDFLAFVNNANTKSTNAT